MSNAALRSRHQDAFLHNVVVLNAVQAYARDRRDDPALAGLGEPGLTVLRGPDGLAEVLPWLRAFEQPMDLYERFRRDVVNGVAFSDDDMEKMAEATGKALKSLRECLNDA